MVTVGNCKKHPLFLVFLGNLPETTANGPLSRENENAHAAPSCIRVGALGVRSSGSTIDLKHCFLCPGHIPWRKSTSRKSHVRQFSWNIVAVTGSAWLLQYLRGSYWVYVIITVSTWQLLGLRGCYSIYVVVTGSTWLLQYLRGSYWVYLVVTVFTW